MPLQTALFPYTKQTPLQLILKRKLVLWTLWWTLSRMTAIVKYLQLEDCTWGTGRILWLRFFQCYSQLMLANNPPSQSLQKVTLQVWSALQCHGVQGFHSVERPHLYQSQTHPGSGWYSSANRGMSYCWLLPGEGTSMTHLPQFKNAFIQFHHHSNWKWSILQKYSI